jgi:hypothetical protein
VAIDDPSGAACAVAVPPDALGTTIHVILVVSDDGDPPLTRYRRIVITGVDRSAVAP